MDLLGKIESNDAVKIYCFRIFVSRVLKQARKISIRVKGISSKRKGISKSLGNATNKLVN